MSEGSGLILQPQSTPTAISNLNLLIVTELAADVENICSSLKSAGVNFTYDAIALGSSAGDLSSKNYDAILYSYSVPSNYKTPEAALEQLDWWYALPKRIPLIAIVNRLNDEIAEQLLQSGISGYVLRHKLHRLPNILKYALIRVARKQQQEKKQSELIREQQKKIEQLEEQLESEKLTWQAAEAKQQKHISHLVHELRLQQQQQSEQSKLIKEQHKKLEQLEEQLESEKLAWQAAEAKQQEHISHLVHELRRPTSSIIGFARMLKDQLYGSLNAKQMQYASALLTTGQHLLDLVNNYLDLAKIEANKETINFEKLPVADVCQASLFMVHQKAHEKDIELILNIANNIDFCWADRVRLKQILVNLLYNAVKFTNQGSVTLDVKIKGNMLNFAVIDTGIGISPENINNLFQPFQQVNHHPEGTGLGLVLSRKLAQLHGGDITVTSKVGKGSCFTLSIPHC